MVSKLTPEQAARIEEVEGFLKTVDYVAKLVAELEQNRAAKSKIIDNICGTLARELSQLRQRALTADIGTIADVAGAMSVMAGRGGGINIKVRALADGVTSLKLQLDHALKQATTPEKQRPERRR